MNIIVKRGNSVPFENLSPNSIALDGYCLGPHIDPEGRRFSFDHHGECLRHVTTATCQQVLDALLLGLRPEGLTVYVNDLDADSVLSVWLLANTGRVHEPVVRELVANVGARDAHGPAYPLGRPHVATRYYFGALAPLVQAKQNGSYQSCDLTELLSLCMDRTSALADGEVFTDAAACPLEQPSIIHQGNGWIMATGGLGDSATLYEAGHLRLGLVRQQADGTWQYTIAKRSEFVSGFPVGPGSQSGTILAALAAIEPGWGGSTTVGGGPRHPDGSRSRLTPRQVSAIVEMVVLEQTGLRQGTEEKDDRQGFVSQRGDERVWRHCAVSGEKWQP